MKRKITTYTREERERYLETWKRSGLSKSVFCRQAGIKLSTFVGWAKRKEETVRQSGLKSKPEFVKLKPSGTGSAGLRNDAAGTAICIQVGRYHIGVGSAFETAVLQRVLNLLEDRDVH